MNVKSFKQRLLNELYIPYHACTMCPLSTTGRTHVVFGEGNPDARLMLVGEGPGQQEDIQGRPFVGRSGQLLTKALKLFNMDRSSIFITNIVKCRPPGNRTPTLLESNQCKELLLLKQIKIIRPKIICTLGTAALVSLTNQPIKITKIRGTLIPWQKTYILPTVHPAYILRNPSAFELFLQDIKKAVEITQSCG